MGLKKHKKRWIIISVSLFLITGTLGLKFLFEKTGGIFPAYRNFSRNLMKILSSITGIVPFAVWDYIAVLLILFVILGFVLVILKKKKLMDHLLSILLIGSVIFSIVIDGWMLNHYAPALSEELGMEIREYSEDELYEATAYYFEKAASYAENVARDEDGKLMKQDFEELAKVCGKCYEPLEKMNSIFTGSTKPVKRLTLYGNILLTQGYTGIFMPFTGEASVPYNESDLSMAFTMCHEAAHRLGIASEEEANFCAFLACDASEDVRLNYSGYYMAFTYCYNKLYHKNYDRLVELLQERETEDAYAYVLQDAKHQREHYKQFENEKVEEVSDKVYDKYLKSYDVDDGLQSYGEVVDELIAFYLEKTENESTDSD